jgi:hypothetical protein
MPGLKFYRLHGVDKLLHATADLLQSKGLAKGLRIDPATGAIDIIAALAICCGATETELVSSVSTVDFSVATANEAKYFMALDVLNACHPEFEDWADSSDVTLSDVTNFLTKSAERLERAIV